MSVYIITGTSKGIGLAISESIIQLGGKVVGLARSEPLLKEIQTKLGKDKFEFVAGDITDSQVHDKVVELAASVGEIKGIVHNAAVAGAFEVIEKADINDIKKTFNINLFSVIELTQKALPHLNKSNGNIILISSGTAITAYKGMSPYCLSKAALNMLGGLLAVEYPNIGTLAVTPGMVDTDMQTEIREGGSGVLSPEMKERFLKVKENNELLPPHVPGLAIAKLVTGTIPKDKNGQFVKWDIKF